MNYSSKARREKSSANEEYRYKYDTEQNSIQIYTVLIIELKFNKANDVFEIK